MAEDAYEVMAEAHAADERRAAARLPVDCAEYASLGNWESPDVERWPVPVEMVAWLDWHTFDGLADDGRLYRFTFAPWSYPGSREEPPDHGVEFEARPL
jgi:hypothetical protein